MTTNTATKPATKRTTKAATKPKTTEVSTRGTTKKDVPVKPLRKYTLEDALAQWSKGDNAEGVSILHRGKAVAWYAEAGHNVRDIADALTNEGHVVGKSTVANVGFAYALVEQFGFHKVSDPNAVTAITKVIRVVNRTGGAAHLRNAFKEAPTLTIDAFLDKVEDVRLTITAKPPVQQVEGKNNGDDPADTEATESKPKGDRVAITAATITAEQYAQMIRTSPRRTWNESEAEVIREALADVLAEVTATDYAPAE
jgi:hypothetical protein